MIELKKIHLYQLQYLYNKNILNKRITSYQIKKYKKKKLERVLKGLNYTKRSYLIKKFHVVIYI